MNIKLPRFWLFALISVCCAYKSEAQLPYYISIEAGTNYAFQASQVITLVGANTTNNFTPTATITFADGQQSAIYYQSANQIFTGITNISVARAAACFEVSAQPYGDPNTLSVIPQNSSAVIQLQTSYNLSGGQWNTLYSQTFTNSMPTNQFVRLSLMAQ